ncbi:MAG: DUF2147 domain-containing protein [Rubrivivax sp.]|nr:DUF2147 domain-containing protein [Rubrivivax sp.]
MKHLLAALLLALSGSAFAQASPVGLWKTIDDETQKEKSYVRITEMGGVLSGKIEKLLDPAKQESKCDKCTDARKDQPVLGMVIVRNVKAAADDKALWEGGDILDPNNGKVYSVRIKPIDGGAKLEVRGFIGFALLGRTQTWIRVE